MTYYVDLEEYDKGRAVVEDYVIELSSEGASEMASVFSQYVCINVTIYITIFTYMLSFDIPLVDSFCKKDFASIGNLNIFSNSRGKFSRKLPICKLHKNSHQKRYMVFIYVVKVGGGLYTSRLWS